MKASIKTYKIKKAIVLAFGIFAACVILSGQSFYYNFSYKLAQEKQEVDSHNVQQDETDQGAEDLSFSIANDAISPGVQLSVPYSLHFIADIFLSEKDKLVTEFEERIEFNTYFKTLFRRIISPNAP